MNKRTQSREKILITGGAGYIGSHTALELIAEGHTPVIVDNFSNSERGVIDRIERISGVRPVCYEGDVRDEAFLERVLASEPDIEGVIHFAALKSVGESIREPLRYHDNNTRSLLSLLSVMKRKAIKYLVFSSSATVYGEPKENPISEDAEIREASSPYGATKIIAERILRDHVAGGEDVGVVSLRYFNPIGAHPSGELGELPIGAPNNLVPYITQTAAGVREKLTIFGDDYETNDGTCVRDFIHVMDLAKAHIATLSFLVEQGTPYHGVFNVGTGEGTSVRTLVNLFEEVTGQRLPIEFGPRRSGDIAVCYAETRRITEVIGWKPSYSLRDALLHAWRWEQRLRTEE